MSFITFQFACFAAITLLAYFLIPLISFKKNGKTVSIPQWAIILVASIVFYAWSSWVGLIYLFVSTIISYLAAVLPTKKFFNVYRNEYGKLKVVYVKRPIAVSARRRYAKTLLIISIIVNVSILAVLKYFNFFSEVVASIIEADPFLIDFIVPIGLSFYTFSLISYNVDCHRQKYFPETNILKFLLYVSYFPRILQGPISTYETMKTRGLYERHYFKDVDVMSSLSRFAIGLLKKVLIADVIGIFVDTIFANYQTVPGPYLILGAVFYAIQLYCDFSGFIDMGIGISAFMGIQMEENFLVPYLSESIGDFWRRWHVTLGRWLRDYIYIPLGGSRCTIWRYILNVVVVWLVSGLWHGANWTFVVWGLYFAVLIILGRIAKSKLASFRKEHNIYGSSWPLRVFNVVKTFVLVTAGWVFFRSVSVKDAVKYFLRILDFSTYGNAYDLFGEAGLSWGYLMMALLMCLLLIALLVIRQYDFKHKHIRWSEKILPLVKYVGIVAVFALSIYMATYVGGLGNGGSSFIYFEF